MQIEPRFRPLDLPHRVASRRRVERDQLARPVPLEARLDELARVARRRVHLTVPWLARTRINARPPAWPETESHIFEFSQPDFERIASHSRLRITHRDRVTVFPRPRNPLSDMWLRVFMYPNYFPALQYYELEPVR